MKKIITSFNLKPLNIVLALVLVFIGFFIDLQENKSIGALLHITNNTTEQIIKVSGTFIFGVLGFYVLVGKEGYKEIFTNANKPIKYFFIGFVILYISSIIGSKLITDVFKWNIAANKNFENIIPSIISLPFFMVFEELWTFTMLFIISNLIYKKTSNFKLSFNVATIVSALIFGFAHWSAYYAGGSVIQTIGMLLINITISRLIFNWAFLKSNTFSVPYFMHLAFDSLGFLAALAVMAK